MKWASKGEKPPEVKPFRLPLPRDWNDAQRAAVLAALKDAGIPVMKGYQSWDGDVHWVYPPDLTE